MPESDFTPEPAISSAQPVFRRRIKMIIKRVLIYGVVFFTLWWSALYLYQDHLIYPRDMAPQPLKNPGRYGKRTIETKLDIGEGAHVVSWFVPAVAASPSRPAPMAVFFHGNAEIIDFEDEIVQPYLSMGISVLLPEYRGYGRSGGEPSERAIVEDCIKLLDRALSLPEVDKSRVVFHGRSLGGGVALQVATQRKPSAVILQSTFVSMAAMANAYAAPGFLVRDSYRNDRVLPTLGVPVLIAHGSRDNIIPYFHAQKLQQLTPQSTLITYDCDHNGFPGDENIDDYWEHITKFLHSAGIIPQR